MWYSRTDHVQHGFTTTRHGIRCYSKGFELDNDKLRPRANYSPSFIHWLQILYAGTNCKVINNGWFSESISLDRRVHQGCPPSPLLYTIAIETLADAIWKHPRIEGIYVPSNQKGSKAYADDSTLTLKDDLSVARAFDIIHKFE